MTENTAIRLKVYFENDTNIERVVDVDYHCTLEDLHLTILAAFEFSAGEMASFWLCDNLWVREQEVPMIRMFDDEEGEESASMADVETFAAINMQRPFLIYEYDMLLMWVLRIEYVETVAKIETLDYPVLVADKGTVPNADEAKAKLLTDASNTDTSESETSEEDDIFEDGGGYDQYGAEDSESQYPDY